MTTTLVPPPRLTVGTMNVIRIVKVPDVSGSIPYPTTTLRAISAPYPFRGGLFREQNHNRCSEKKPRRHVLGVIANCQLSPIARILPDFVVEHVADVHLSNTNSPTVRVGVPGRLRSSPIFLSSFFSLNSAIAASSPAHSFAKKKLTSSKYMLMPGLYFSGRPVKHRRATVVAE